MRMNPPAGSGLVPSGSPFPLLMICLAAALLAAWLVRVMIGVAPLDVPGHRSSHQRPTPKGGGVGVMAALLVGLPLAHWLDGSPEIRALLCIELGAGILALVSWLDDVHQFSPALKLATQAGAAILVLSGTGALPFRAAGVPAAFAWLLFVTNALNFIDGLNGLASGSMALAGLVIGLSTPCGLPRELGLLLAAGLFGFLPFNFPQARIFLGDVGSQGAGLTLAALGLLHVQHAASTEQALLAPLLLAGILYDVAFTLCRRVLNQERPWQAHRGHLYQVAFRSGMPAPWVALLHWGFVLYGAGLGIALSDRMLSLAAALPMVALPQLAWTVAVGWMARRAGVRNW